MSDIANFKPESHQKFLLVGESGSGKSGAGVSFGCPYHELDFDRRIAGIADLVAMGILADKRITYQQFDGMGGWKPVSKELHRLNQLKVAHALNPNMQPFPYKGIGVGSLYTLSRLVLSMFYDEQKGQHVGGDGEGTLRLSHPGDYRAESNGVNQVLDYLFAMPCNLFVTCHTVDVYGRPAGSTEADAYKPSEVIGDKLNITSNLSAGILGRFDNVFKFYRIFTGSGLQFKVEFTSKICKNTFGIPSGQFDFTGKPFYPEFQKLIEKYKRKEVSA